MPSPQRPARSGWVPGGVMLPNHAPLDGRRAVQGTGSPASRPDRPGPGPCSRHRSADHAWRCAAARSRSGQDDFLDGFYELLALERRTAFPRAIPSAASGSCPRMSRSRRSGCWARAATARCLAAETGLGFAFAHHFAQHAAEDAMHAYRRGFQPSIFLEKPHAILAVAVMCAATEAEAERLAATFDYNTYNRNRGQFCPLASPKDALAQRYSAVEEQERLEARQRLFVGTPGQGLRAPGRLRHRDAGRRADGDLGDLRPRGPKAILHAAGRGFPRLGQQPGPVPGRYAIGPGEVPGHVALVGEA